MTDSDSNSGKFDAVVKAYLLAKESGDSPSREQLLEKHPEISKELKEFFKRQDRPQDTKRRAGDKSKLNLDATVDFVDGEDVEKNEGTQGFVVSELDTQARTVQPDSVDQPSPPTTSTPSVKNLGDYELLEEIGHGGMGVVYRAKQVSLDRIVALKTIRSGKLATKKEVERFHTEAEAAAELDHPAIVPVFEVGESDGTHFFSMGYVEGRSLGAKLQDGPLLPREAADLVAQLAKAVAYAHDKGVIHRDLKPDNVLLDSQGQPRITDFGLAKRTDTDSAQTQTGEILGTPSYMPPEQASGSRKIGPTSDVYGLGAILYASLTVRPPFQAASQIDTLMQVLENEPVSPRQMDPGIPRDLDTICLKCLQKEQDKRYRSATELADDLKRFVDGQPIKARPVGTTERMWMWCKRNPKIAIPSAAATLLGLVLMIGGPILAIKFYDEKEKAVQQRKLADTTAELANQGSRAVLDQIYDAYAKQDLKERLLMKDLLEVVLDETQKVQTSRDAYLATAQVDANLDIAESSSYKKLGELSLEFGRIDEAREYLEKSLNIAIALEAEGGLEEQHFNFANIYKVLGRTYEKLGRLDDSEESYQKALEHWKQFVKTNPDQEDGVLERMAGCYSGLGTVAKKRGNPDEALKHAENALKLRRELEARFPENLILQRRLAADTYLKARKQSDYAKAKTLFDEAIAAQQSLLEKRPDARLDVIRLARYRMGLADNALQAGKPAEAKSIYADVILSLNASLEEIPENGSATNSLGHAYYALGIACQQTNDDNAKEHFKKGLAVRQTQFDKDPENKSTKIKLMFALARCNDHEEASAWARRIHQNSPNAGDLVAIAGAYALCSAAENLTPTDKQKYLQDSLDSLQAAVNSGYKNVHRLRVDPDLAPIQDHEDFRKLLEQIEKGKG